MNLEIHTDYKFTLRPLNPLSANPPKWSNTLKQDFQDVYSRTTQHFKTNLKISVL